MIALVCMIWGWIRRLRSPQGKHHLFWMGWRLTTFWVGGVLLNTCLKYLIRAPRPWWINIDLAPVHPHPASGFGMPSGHTQSAVGILLGLWCLSRLIQARSEHQTHSHRWFQLALTSLGMIWVLGIAVTRISLHAHSLAQVCGGGALGLGWAGFIVWAERSSQGVKLLASFVLILTIFGLWLTHHAPELPSEWTQVILAHQVTPPTTPSIAHILIFGALSLAWTALLTLKQPSANQGGYNSS